MHQTSSFIASIFFPPLVLCFWPFGALQNMLMQDISQVRWTQAKSEFFSSLPLLWATNTNAMQDSEEKKERNLPLPHHLS